MNAEPKVDYAEVREDFEFFLAHSNETEAQIKAMTPYLGWLSRGPQPVQFLDFGCGTGDFTAQLLGALEPPPADLEISLLEPVAEHLQQAANALSPFAERFIESVPYISSLEGKEFDFILANHSLYFLTEQEVADLLRRVAPERMMIAALLHHDNALAQIWLKACVLMNEEFPFIFAETVENVLRDQRASYEREMVGYKIEFPDTGDNRYRVLHFLFGAYLNKIPKEQALGLFDPHRTADKIRIETEYPHLIVRGA